MPTDGLCLNVDDLTRESERLRSELNTLCCELDTLRREASALHALVDALGKAHERALAELRNERDQLRRQLDMLRLLANK